MPQVTVVITSWLEPELVDAVRAVDPVLDVRYDPRLVPAPRYPSDHGGVRPALDAAAAQRWRSWLREADICLDFDWADPAALPVNAPRLQWVQATSAGIGQFVTRTGLSHSDIVFTTAAGVHAVSLAEFALTGVLFAVKGVPELRRRQQAHRWERYATRSVAGLHAVVVGLGSIGRETCRLFAAAGLRVTGVGRPERSYDVAGASRIATTDQLDQILPTADVTVLACPLTEQTRDILSRERIAMLPTGAVVVNIARGPCLDETALLEALAQGRLAGAALDVFDHEPLPPDSPWWLRDDVLVSPHSASTLPDENQAIIELFTDNLRRWLTGRPLRNVYDRDRGY